MVIIDTTVWIDYLRGNDTPQTAWLEREAMRQRLGLTDLILCEVLQGISDSRTFSDFRDDLLKLHIFETGGVELAIAAAKNYQRLRQRAYTVRKTIDCLIATFCLRGGHSLLHCDKDFDPFEKLLGLSVVHA
jgi:predicted nucleic acid-binding protein